MDDKVKMKIKLLVNLPILEVHGAVKGRVFEVIREEDIKRGARGAPFSKKYWFIGQDGTQCAAWPNEVELVPDRPHKDK